MKIKLLLPGKVTPKEYDNSGDFLTFFNRCKNKLQRAGLGSSEKNELMWVNNYNRDFFVAILETNLSGCYALIHLHSGEKSGTITPFAMRLNNPGEYDACQEINWTDGYAAEMFLKTIATLIYNSFFNQKIDIMKAADYKIAEAGRTLGFSVMEAIDLPKGGANISPGMMDDMVREYFSGMPQEKSPCPFKAFCGSGIGTTELTKEMLEHVGGLQKFLAFLAGDKEAIEAVVRVTLSRMIYRQPEMRFHGFPFSSKESFKEETGLPQHDR